MNDIIWHHLTDSEIFDNVQGSKIGLKSASARERLSKYGRNILPSKKGLSWSTLLSNQFKSSLVYILVAAAIISIFLAEYIDAGVILAAVLLNVVVGFIQEFKAQKSLEELKKVVRCWAVTLRDGEHQKIDSEELVVGDIVILNAGDRVPADARVLESSDLEVSEASLTGESTAVPKDIRVLGVGTILAERSNMVFMGTVVTRGTGVAIIIATGKNTEFGKIAQSFALVNDELTPLQKRLLVLSRNIAWVFLVLSIIIFLIGYFQGHSVRDTFLTAVALGVSAIPEGLLIGVTVILTVGMKRLLKKQALVRQLVAAETLGSTTVICTDKTGTLTTGNQRVAKIVTLDKSIDDIDIFDVSSVNMLEELEVVYAGVLCNNAFINNPDDEAKEWELIGDPTEAALLIMGHQLGIDQKKVLVEYPRVDEIPFDSDRKVMVTMHERDDHKLLYLKGASEEVLNYCSQYKKEGKVFDLDQEMINQIKEQFQQLSSEGLRVLAFGYKRVDRDVGEFDSNDIYKGFVFLGLVGIKDPVRPEVVDLLKVTTHSGIRVVMITGDHRLTAQAIARDLGLPHNNNNILEGKELIGMTDQELTARVADISVYARVMPEDKLRIVQAWQSRGEVVSMTGDGVNDVPALQKANIGVALGSGTDVAKDASDLVLLDNNFATIISAIREGRIIFANIKKLILYLLSDSLTGVFIILGSMIMEWPLPILVTQILWINLISDGLPAVALTMEPGDKDIELKKPITKKVELLDTEMKFLIIFIGLITGVATLALFYMTLNSGGNLNLARTVAFTCITIFTLMYSFSCKNLDKVFWHPDNFRNKWLWLALAISVIMQLLAVYNVWFQKIFATVPLSLSNWLGIIVMGLFVVFSIELVKVIFRWYK